MLRDVVLAWRERAAYSEDVDEAMASAHLRRCQLTTACRAWQTTTIAAQWEKTAMRTAVVHRALALATDAMRRWRAYAVNAAADAIAMRTTFEAWVEGRALAAVASRRAEELFARKRTYCGVYFKKWVELIEREEGKVERLQVRAASARANAHRRSTLKMTALAGWLHVITESISQREKTFESLSQSLRSTVRRNKS